MKGHRWHGLPRPPSENPSKPRFRTTNRIEMEMQASSFLLVNVFSWFSSLLRPPRGGTFPRLFRYAHHMLFMPSIAFDPMFVISIQPLSHSVNDRFSYSTAASGVI